MEEPTYQPSDSGVAERLPLGVYPAVDAPSDMPKRVFFDVLEAVTELYRRHKSIPSVELIAERYERLSVGVIGAVMVTQEFKGAAEARGIALRPQDGLTPLQVTVLTALDTPQDLRSTMAKLRAVGVELATFNMWKKNPLFMQAFDHMTRGQYQEALPEIRSKVIGLAVSGNMQAAQFVFDKTNESPGAGKLEDVKQVVLTMVQAIQRHCTPEQRQAILADVQLTMQAVSVSPQELAS